MRTYLILLLAAATILSACNQGTNSDDSNSSSKIDSLEALVFENQGAKSNPKTAMNLVREYSKYYQTNQPDSLAVDRLFKAAELSMGIGQGNLAVKYFRTVSDDHKDFYKVPEAMFLLGFCSENLVKDTAQARFFYNKFIEAHPEHHLAQDAKFSIQNMGMSDEELIKMFEEKLGDQKVEE